MLAVNIDLHYQTRTLHMGGDKGLLSLVGKAQDIQQIRYSQE